MKLCIVPETGIDLTLSAEVLYNFRKSVLELKDRLKEKSMDIICAILTGFHYLVERTKRLAERVKSQKKADGRRRSL